MSTLGYLQFFLSSALIFAVISLGLNIQWGLTGLFNAGIAGFVAVGAYVSALLTSAPVAQRIGGLDWPIGCGWIAAVLACGILAALIGSVTLRLREDYLAITTFGIAIVIQLLLVNQQSWTGGPFGISFIPKMFESLADRPLLFSSLNSLLMIAVVGSLYLALQTLARSPWGRVLRAIREDRVAAASLGKNVRWYELQAFVLGAMVMGFGGALQAHFVGFISPDDYVPLLTFQVWAMLIIGGSGSNGGAIVGSLVVWGLWSASGYLLGRLIPAEYQTQAAALRPILIGVALVVILIRHPQGLLGRAAFRPARKLNTQ